MSPPSRVLASLLALAVSLGLPGGAAPGAEEPRGSCRLAGGEAPLVSEPPQAFRTVQEYGRQTFQVSGPGQAAMGEVTWSSYTVDLKLQLVRGEVVFEFLRGPRGRYALWVGRAGLRLERADAGGRVEVLEQAFRPMRAGPWHMLRIDLAPPGEGDRVLVAVDGEVVIGNPDDTFASGGFAVVAPAGSLAKIRDLRVEGPCEAEAAPPATLAQGCAPAAGQPEVQSPPVLEAEASGGQWRRGEVTYDTSDFFSPPVPLKFRGASTDGSCPRATSTVRFRLAREGSYFILARLFSPGGRAHNDLVRATLTDEAGRSLPPLNGEALAAVFGHGSGLFAMGQWRLEAGLYSLAFQAVTQHPLVVDYFVLVPQIRVGERALVVLPRSVGMHRDGWTNGMAALTVESSALASSPGAALAAPLAVPLGGRYTLLVDTLHSGGEAPLQVSIAGARGSASWTIGPGGPEGAWSTHLLGPFDLPGGAASATFTHGGAAKNTTWAVDTILLIPEGPSGR